MAEDHLVSYCFSFFVQEPGEAWSDLPNYNVWLDVCINPVLIDSDDSYVTGTSLQY